MTTHGRNRYSLISLLAVMVAGIAVGNALSGCRPSLGSETMGIRSTINRAATAGTGDACRMWGSHSFDNAICSSIDSGSPLPGTDNGLCRYYCNPHNSCVSPFRSRADLSDALAEIESWIVAPQNVAWSVGSAAGAIGAFIQQTGRVVHAEWPKWRSWLSTIEEGATSDNRYTRGLCVANMIYTLHGVINQFRAFQDNHLAAKKDPLGYGEVPLSAALAKASCAAAYVTSSCAIQLGFGDTLTASLAAISVGCSVGSFTASAIQCETARNCCMAERDAARAVSVPMRSRDGSTYRSCCVCERSVWDDRTWPRRDVLITRSEWRGVAAEGTEVSGECELREGRMFPSLVQDERGRSTFSTFSNCRRVVMPGDRCR